MKLTIFFCFVGFILGFQFAQGQLNIERINQLKNLVTGDSTQLKIKLQNFQHHNFNEVDTPEKRWRQLLKWPMGNLKDFILLGGGGGTKGLETLALPIDEIFANVTSQVCVGHMVQWITELSALVDSIENFTGIIQFPSLWGLQMVDAWGKIPDGILSGHTTSLGDFEECLQIRGGIKSQDEFKGQYCLTYLLPNFDLSSIQNTQEVKGQSKATSLDDLLNVMQTQVVGALLYPRMGTCFPSTCSKDDVQTILNNAHALLTQNLLSQPIVQCYTEDKPKFAGGTIAMIAILSCIALLCVIGTLADILIIRRKKNLNETAAKFLVAFSVYTNTLKLLSIPKKGGDNLGCLHGLRFLSMAYVLLGHTGEHFFYHQVMWNNMDIVNLYKENWTLWAILNSTPSVDTFFVISGCLAAYHMLKLLDKTKGKLNVPLLYIHRYLRLTPTYMLIVGIMATLVPYMGYGPNWHMIDEESRICRKYWWHNLLYITNLSRYREAEGGVCYDESWYLSNDFQFFLVSPFIIYPIWKRKKIGLALLGVLNVTSIVIPTVIKATKKLMPTAIFNIEAGSFYDDFYYPPWTRIGPYLVGIVLGYVLYSQSKTAGNKRNWLTKLNLPIWLVTSAAAMSIMFGVQRYSDPENSKETYESVGSHLYAGFHRYVWGICIAWIIYACVNGHGGWVNSFLSWTPFIPLGRLTFCMYLVSYKIQNIFHLTLLTPWNFNIYILVNMFFAHLVMTLLVGYIFTVTMESPFMQLEKILLPEKGGKPISKSMEAPEIGGKSAD